MVIYKTEEIVPIRHDDQQLFLFLDYDGTLVPIKESPHDAIPTSELLNLLSPEVKELLLEPNIQAVLRILRNCSAEEVRFILDFIRMFKESNICD